jgi:hypothetical protein
MSDIDYVALPLHLQPLCKGSCRTSTQIRASYLGLATHISAPRLGSSLVSPPPIYTYDEFNQMTLTRFWFTFNLTLRDPHPPGVLMGCGVTAFGAEDALRILKENVFVSHCFPEIEETLMDVDISKLDQGHVRPNMGDPSRRGVWFPLGYSCDR